jgi:hypothetical protein
MLSATAASGAEEYVAFARRWQATLQVNIAEGDTVILTENDSGESKITVSIPKQ